MSAGRKRDRLEVPLDVVGQLRHHVAGDGERADRPHADVSVGNWTPKLQETSMKRAFLVISPCRFMLHMLSHVATCFRVFLDVTVCSMRHGARHGGEIQAGQQEREATWKAPTLESGPTQSAAGIDLAPDPA